MSTSFRNRALAEAARYGSDSWVFLRELLQNARDAGARRIEITVSEHDDVEQIVCRDDGDGMSYDHARQYLFALYASSKEEDASQAGQFGVGFWSVLRFAPSTVVICSRPREGVGWQVTVDGDLGGAVFADVAMEQGTEIVLERRRHRRALGAQVRQAVAHYGRFLSQRDFRDEPLVVTVNGRSVNVDLTLPPPSSSFRRGACRGVVALSTEPRVELYANGLFVRQASCLEDILEVGKKRRRKKRESLTLPGSLAPHILLDSSELEVLLARSDVRETRPLERLVRSAEQELSRLVESQLHAMRPQPWYLPMWARLREASVKMGLAWFLVMVMAGMSVGWGMIAWQEKMAASLPRLGLQRDEVLESYVDLSSRYGGPQLDPLTPIQKRIDLSYEPSDHGELFFFSALVVEEPTAWDKPPQPPLGVSQYQGIRCGETCITVTLVSKLDAGVVRIPVPTGHQVDPETVKLNDSPQAVRATTVGEPVFVLTAPSGGVLAYRTGPASAQVEMRPPPEAPPELLAAAQELRSLPVRYRVQAALTYVASHIEYDRSAPAVALHGQARRAGKSFIEAALDLRKGDCDIQNGVLAALLRLTGVEARLSVGWVGLGGQALPGLHAWVEYFENGRWKVADASARFRGESEDAGFSRRLLGSGGNPDVAFPDLPPALAVPQPLERTSVPAGADSLSAISLWKGFSGSGLLAIVILALIAVWSRRPAVGGMRLAAEENLAPLLAGALQHAELARLPALRHGRFIPLLKGRSISLHEAERLATSGRLYSSSYGSHLAFRAASRGVSVVDSGVAEGQVTSVALGAVDIDEWSELVDRSRVSELSRRLNSHLKECGESWQVAETTGLGERLRLVDLRALKLGWRIVLIDLHHPDFKGPTKELLRRPETAVFRVLDTIVTELELPAAQRCRLLAAPAMRALHEVADES